MVKWLTGNTGAGKTTLALTMRDEMPGSVILDGDMLRSVWEDIGFTRGDRWKHNHRVANLARLLDSQGINVIVSVICPYKGLREQVQQITNCQFIYVKGGKEASIRYPYEVPENPKIVYDWRARD